jgi:hypothetical protein
MREALVYRSVCLAKGGLHGWDERRELDWTGRHGSGGEGEG